MNKEFYKIYIENRVLQLIDTQDVPFVILKSKTEIIKDYNKDKKTILSSIEQLEANKATRIILHSNDLQKLYKDFCALFQVFNAGGGLILNSNKEILTIYRRKNWDFPKGKIEGKETIKQTAIRECKEECGLDNLVIEKKLGVTYHTFGTKEKRKLKVSTWFLMHTKDMKLTPQKEEDIEEAKWMDAKSFLLLAKPIYPNIIDVYETFLLK